MTHDFCWITKNMGCAYRDEQMSFKDDHFPTKWRANDKVRVEHQAEKHLPILMCPFCWVDNEVMWPYETFSKG